MTEPAATVGETVRARPAPRLSIRRAGFRENVLGSLWFIPLCASVAAFAVSRGTLLLDEHTQVRAGDLGLPGDSSALTSTAATVAAVMLTFLGVVFSTTLVAIQLASSQYSPRIVRVFVRSRLTQATLGTFLATFVFSLNALVGSRAVEREAPAITVAGLYVLALATVVIFIAFIHGIVRLLRVQYLLRLTAIASHEAIDYAFPPADAYRSASPPPMDQPSRPVMARQAIAGHHGNTPRILQAVDVAGLAELAASHDAWIELCVAVGEHAGPAAVVARIHGPRPAAITDEDVFAHLLLGSERTMVQDPACGVRQLVDTASRALSPAVNDPTTGVQALLRVEDLLVRIADHPDPTGWYTDAAGAVRVRMVDDDFERLARLGLTEILRYGADAPQVTRCLLAIYDDLDRVVLPERRPIVEALRHQCHQAMADAMPAAFLDVARKPDHLGLG